MNLRFHCRQPSNEIVRTKCPPELTDEISNRSVPSFPVEIDPSSSEMIHELSILSYVNELLTSFVIDQILSTLAASR